jgi:hypothetical protein
MAGMVAGLVVVDDDGNESFAPDDATNCAKVYYVALLATVTTLKKQQKAPIVPLVHNPDGSFSQGGVTIVNADGSRIPFLWSDGSTHNVPEPPKPIMVTVTVKPDAATKQKMAEFANALAVIIPYMQANAVAVIPNTSAGDGLMRDSGGGACQHPTSQKTLKIQ